MLSLKTNKILSVPKNPDYFRESSDNEYNIRKYILEVYGYSPCYVYLEEIFSHDALELLIEKGELICFQQSGDIKKLIKNPKVDFKSAWFWFKYKDVFIKISLKNENYDEDAPIFISGGLRFLNKDKSNKPVIESQKTYNISFVAPSNVQDYPLADFEDFIITESDKPKVHLFIKNQYGDYTFEPISVNIPDKLDLKLNYGNKFEEIDKMIKERLAEKPNGLYMFHGPPGTGKTTYIKYLASCVDRDFIYIPTTMIEYFTSDPNCLHTLIQRPNSIIILEDAEKAILKRMGDGMDSSAVSALLNLSDGILSDILKTSVIVTYNCPRQDIDDALKRKGRLQVEYEFGLLQVEDAIKLAKSLKYPKKFIEEKITQPISLSDVYNLEKEVEFYDAKKKPEPRVIGFNQN
jgi:hypothetical protein